MSYKPQIEANRRYQEANYEQLSIKVPKGERDLFKEFAKEAGLSLREFVRSACYEKHEKNSK
ncbi:hypothetical protein [Megasphaera elsdenii]|uniref:hypothetical protein n=1 Tax=Megasphaera elsdenii TaxID=907 RepID=UPI00242D42EA|nr:hypothetical protein [Megasphaera elsdenii]